MHLFKIQSRSLGDTIASLHVIEKFREINTDDERIGVIGTNTEHYIKSYPMFDFYPPDTEPIEINGKYFCSSTKMEYNKFQRIIFNLHENLLEGIAKQLGIPDELVINDFPKIDYFDPSVKKEKLITFSMHATAQLKHWNYPEGWKILISKLKKQGYKVVNVDMFDSFGAPGYWNPVPKNCIKMQGLELKEKAEIINKSEFFIGIGSGLSWFAHSLQIPVVLISGMSNLECEFKKSILRIGSQSKCRNCFVNPKYRFDPGDWLWCPEYKGTPREFECSKSITPDHVFQNIQRWIESGKKEIFI